jgi:hypothetical protein
MPARSRARPDPGERRFADAIAQSALVCLCALLSDSRRLPFLPEKHLLCFEKHPLCFEKYPLIVIVAIEKGESERWRLGPRLGEAAP